MHCALVRVQTEIRTLVPIIYLQITSELQIGMLMSGSSVDYASLYGISFRLALQFDLISFPIRKSTSTNYAHCLLFSADKNLKMLLKLKRVRTFFSLLRILILSSFLSQNRIDVNFLLFLYCFVILVSSFGFC